MPSSTDSLSISEEYDILEIGFGPGELIHAMACRVDRGRVEGVDFSETMLAIAQRRNRQHIRTGKVRLHLGDFDGMAFDGRRFDTIVTVNTVYFWPQPEATIARIGDLLKPGDAWPSVSMKKPRCRIQISAAMCSGSIPPGYGSALGHLRRF